MHCWTCSFCGWTTKTARSRHRELSLREIALWLLVIVFFSLTLQMLIIISLHDINMSRTRGWPSHLLSGCSRQTQNAFSRSQRVDISNQNRSEKRKDTGEPVKIILGQILMTYQKMKANIRKTSTFSAAEKKKPKLYKTNSKSTVYLQTRPGGE